MKRFVTKTLFLFILFISFSLQNSITQIHVPHSKTQEALVFDSFKEKSPGRTEKMLQFTAGGHILGFRKGDVFIASGDHALRIEFVNARPASPVNEEISPDDNRQTAEPLGRVSYSDLWDGVTLVYERHSTGVVKSTYTIQPEGTDASSPADRIRLRYNVPVAVDDGGNLVCSFETGQMRELRPVAWQEIKGEHIPVEVSFRSLSEQEVGFKVESYDPQFPLVIDGAKIWNTFMGTEGTDSGEAIAVDGSGSVYVAGYSSLTWGTPVNAHAGWGDAFAAKLNSSGARQWHTFMGSVNSDNGNAIAVDTSGNVYVAGRSQATWGTPGNPHAGSADAFAAKLNSSGVRQWHTFMGSIGSDYGRAIAVDGSGSVYVAGYSSLTWGTPVNPHAGSFDAFTAKLNSSGVRQWNTFMGSSSNDEGHGIAVDTSGNVYLTGYCGNTWGTPINPHAGGDDAFAAKLNSSGVRQWNTFMGSSMDDYGRAIAVDGSGNVYVAGYSFSTWGTPVNPHTGGLYDAFAAKLGTNGVRQWNTFMGGTQIGLNTGNDYGNAIAVDTSGNVYVAGNSSTTWGTPDNPHAGGNDAFAAKLNSSGARQWHTFMGSGTGDEGRAIAVDTSGNVYVAGYSYATWGTPVIAHAGRYDAFVAKITDTSYYVFDGHDFTGNGMSDIAIWRPSDGIWYLRNIGTYPWGTIGDIPVNGNYNGDSTTDIAIWRPSDGTWYIRNIATYAWGTIGDIPVPGDYNGDGITDMAVWRPSDGTWYIRDIATYAWGTTSDIPVPGDYNGDGTTDIAVWRPSDGTWYIRNIATYAWGTTGDIPVPGDYNGDGTTDVAVWRSSDGIWYLRDIATYAWGTTGDIPVPGDYNGDGTTDVAVWRPSYGGWYIRNIGVYFWGTSGDIPLVR